LCFKELGAENRRPNTAGTISVVVIAYCRKIAYPLISLTYLLTCLLTSHLDSVPPLGTISRKRTLLRLSTVQPHLSRFFIRCVLPRLLWSASSFLSTTSTARCDLNLAPSLFLPARLYLAVRCAEKRTDWIRAENCGQVQKTNFVIRHWLTRRYLRTFFLGRIAMPSIRCDPMLPTHVLSIYLNLPF